MKTVIQSFIIIILFISCNFFERKEEKKLTVESKINDKEKDTKKDFIEVLTESIKNDLVLEKEGSFHDKEIINFTKRYSSSFINSELSRELQFSSVMGKTKVFVKEWIFLDKEEINKIVEKIELGVYSEIEIIDGIQYTYKFDEIKMPHGYYVYKNRLYIFYTNAVSDGSYVDMIKEIVKSEEFKKKLFNT